MGKKLNCSFQPACIYFNQATCLITNIDAKECGGPIIKGLKIVAVANISDSGHKIAIISQCPELNCKKILGVVTGDIKPIPYRAEYIILADKMKKKIPQVVCRNCSEYLSHGQIVLDVTSQQAQTSATA